MSPLFTYCQALTFRRGAAPLQASLRSGAAHTSSLQAAHAGSLHLRNINFYICFMILLRPPYSLLLHFFFVISIVLHLLSLYQHDFEHESQISHVLQLLSYLAGWILLFFPIKGRQYLFPLAVAFPWIEHLRLMFQYFHDPATLAFWICLLVAVLLPCLTILLFKTRDN